MQVLNLVSQDGKTSVQIHMLQPGEFFPHFGGRKSGLYAGTTASLVTRWVAASGLKDTEYDIADPRPWKWVEELINWHNYRVTAAQPCGEQTDKPPTIDNPKET